jgi:hypothetical protein
MLVFYGCFKKYQQNLQYFDLLPHKFFRNAGKNFQYYTTGTGAYPISYPIDTGGSFSGVKVAGA